jgi:hypothetical protein
MTLNAFDRLVLPFQMEFSAGVVELQLLPPPAQRRVTGGAARTQFSPMRVLMAVVARAMFKVLENSSAEGRARCLGFMAFHTLNARVLSLEMELSVGMVELQVLALPAGRGMAGGALFSQSALVEVLVAIQAGIKAQAHIVSGWIVAVYADLPRVAFLAFNVFMFSFPFKGGHIMIKFFFIEYNNTVCTVPSVVRVFFMANDALLVIIFTVIP